MTRPARVILTGGAYAIRKGLRGETLDVDFAYEVAPADDTHFVQAIRELKEDLRMNLEFAEPGQFIPMPAGRAGRREFVGRYGTVDVFLDDPYAIALSKLHRGHDRDIDDLRRLSRAGLIDLDALAQKVREIAAPGREGALRVDPERLLARLERLRDERPPA